MKKIGFWPLFAIVIGGQVGSGVFILPANLAPYGFFGILGLIIAAFGAISLAITFATLCFYYPKTGGAHVYVHIAFGKTAAFFTGWTYWVISWVSSNAVIISTVSYFIPIFGDYPKSIYLLLEVIVLLLVTLVNLRGVSSAGHFEVFLSVIKFSPLILIPFFALLCFEVSNIKLDQSFQNYNISSILNKVVLVVLWGFLGLETATTPADSVINPKRNVPLAVISGTLFVAVIYLVNSLSIMGVIPGEELMYSSAPYSEATRYIFGDNWYVIISLVASVVCLSSLNAWILTSGQIVLGLAEDGLMPKLFTKKNSQQAPYVGLLISGLGGIPLLFLTQTHTFAEQMALIIDFSVIAFLFVYLISAASLVRIQILKKSIWDIRSFIALVAFLFCFWVVVSTDVKVLLLSAIFVISGLPLYIFWYRKKPDLIVYF